MLTPVEKLNLCWLADLPAQEVAKVMGWSRFTEVIVRHFKSHDLYATAPHRARAVNNALNAIFRSVK